MSLGPLPGIQSRTVSMWQISVLPVSQSFGMLLPAFKKAVYRYLLTARRSGFIPIRQGVILGSAYRSRLTVKQ